MNPNSIYPCGRINRRGFLTQAGGGFFGAALGAVGAVVRSMGCNEGNHFPAVIETTTGHRGRQFDHPTLGAWVSYALGTANQNLPTFVNMGRASSPVQLTGGYLGATVSATPFQPGDTPIPNLIPPKSS